MRAIVCYLHYWRSSLNALTHYHHHRQPHVPQYFNAWSQEPASHILQWYLSLPSPHSPLITLQPPDRYQRKGSLDRTTTNHPIPTKEKMTLFEGDYFSRGSYTKRPPPLCYWGLIGRVYHFRPNKAPGRILSEYLHQTKTNIDHIGQKTVCLFELHIAIARGVQL